MRNTRIHCAYHAAFHAYAFVERVVAQLGRALRSGRRGRRFKSCQPDHFLPVALHYAEVFCSRVHKFMNYITKCFDMRYPIKARVKCSAAFVAVTNADCAHA